MYCWQCSCRLALAVTLWCVEYHIMFLLTYSLSVWGLPLTPLSLLSPVFVSISLHSVTLRPPCSLHPLFPSLHPREFLSYVQRYKLFFAVLPEMLCEGETVGEDFTCWSGDDVVER